MPAARRRPSTETKLPRKLLKQKVIGLRKERHEDDDHSDNKLTVVELPSAAEYIKEQSDANHQDADYRHGSPVVDRHKVSFVTAIVTDG
jgi:hypothetical protein